MTHVAVISRVGAQGVLPARAGRLPAHVVGERLAVASTAIAVATIPLLVPSGPGRTAPADLLIGIALLGCLFWLGASGQRLHFPYVASMGLFMVGGALGALAGPLPGTGALTLIQDFALLAWCWAVVAVTSSPRRLRVILETWAYSSIGWAVLLFIGLLMGSTSLTGQNPRLGGRTALTFIDPNIAANYYVISMMIIWAIGRPRGRALRFGAYVLFTAAIFTTGSNSGVASLIVATLVASLIAVYHRVGIVPAVGFLASILLCGSVIALTVNPGDIAAKAHDSQYKFIREGLGRGDKSVGQRAEIFHESMTLYKTGGLLGQGPVSTKTRLANEMAPFEKEAHDDYFAALVERGVVGVVGLLLLIAGLLYRTLFLARERLAGAFGAVVIRPHALVGAIAGTLVAMTVYELLHVRHVWTLFALIAALFVWGRE